MSEEKEEKKTNKWFGWAKNIVAAVAGAVISCAATIGIIKGDDADVAKQKINGWLEKSETAHVQIVSVNDTIAEVKSLIVEKKYIEALGKLEDIKDSAIGTVTTIKELKEEIQEALKVVSEQAKEKVDEVKETVNTGVEEIKDAIKDKPTKATPEN